MLDDTDDTDSNGAIVDINVDIMVEAKGIELEVWTGFELDTLALITGGFTIAAVANGGELFAIGATGSAFGADGGTAGAANGATAGVANGATCLFFRAYVFILIFCGICKMSSWLSLKLATTRSEWGALFKIKFLDTGDGAFLVLDNILIIGLFL